MESEEFLKKVYASKSPSSKGRPHGRWKDRGIDYMYERHATKRGRTTSSKEMVFGIGRGGGFSGIATPL